ncbi:hypothetical protein [Aeromicrobium duanguangcaii]|uniref:Uncharacterized protein n=1 Tax=Aeromicrobium duanguangcaii TaxID=2968086 RepID=A0ABY5KJ17_9ACTN|nr:hypothetical protein [Aeromicrobium duanguangcaii]MCD9153125.1 hypothetical protein [Aeromicrobium duanguangcaii]UUI69774.1 hypothetical protein NP095_06685 [Aeromicrobium duanguangcaii]
MSSSSDLVILAADCDELPAWTGTLQDWSALGIVRDFVAITLQDVAASTWRALLIADGAATPVILQDEIAARPLVTSVSVLALGTVGVKAVLPDNDISAALRDAVHFALPGIPLTWGQVVNVGTTQGWPQVDPATFAWTGGHTVLLAPENSHSPGGGKAPVPAEELRRPLGLTHGAAGLASAAGLWTGASRGTVHGAPASGGGRVTLLRTYTRHVSTAESANDLLARVIDVSARYPVPVDRVGRQLQRISDENAAAARMARHLLKAHASTLDPSPRVGRDVRAERTPAKEMLRRFFAFLGSALRLAPQTFAHALEAEAARATAPALQRLLLGSNSAYQITVRDITGIAEDGEVVSAVALEADLDARVAALAGDEHTSVSPRHDHPDLWKDFVNGALTLLDGQERSEKLPEPTEAGATAVVTDPRVVVPDLSSIFELPAEAKRLVAVATLPANDFERMGVVEQMIAEQIRREPDSAAEFAHLQRRVDEWRDRSARSYSGQVGRHIAERISGLRTEALLHQEVLRRHGADTGLGDAVLKDQTSLGRWTWAVLLMALATSSVLTFFGADGAIAWTEVAGWIAATWIVALALLLGVFVARQRALFQLIHRRQRERRLAEIAYEDLTATLKDLRRLLAVHRQYVDWSRALTAFVGAPWGEVAPGRERTTELGAGFGHNHRFGRVVIEDAAADELARRAQSEVSEPGWLSDAWQAFLADLPAFEDRHRVEREPELLFSDARMGERPVLTVWSEQIAPHRRFDAARPVLDRLRTFVDEVASEGDRRVLWTDGASRKHDESYQEFVAGVLPSRTRGEFSRHVFATVPETVDPWMVSHTETGDFTPEGGPLVLTQLTEPFPARDLAFCRSGPVLEPVAKSFGDAPQM